MTTEMHFRKQPQERSWYILCLRTVGWVCGILLWLDLIPYFDAWIESSLTGGWLTWNWILLRIVQSIII